MSQADAELAELRTIVSRAREQAMQVTLAMRRARTELAPLRDELRREREQSEKGVREALRNGELGPEQRALAERIERGETTWRDVLTGADDHPSAIGFRDGLETDLTDLVEQLRAEDDEFRAEHDRARVRADGR